MDIAMPKAKTKAAMATSTNVNPLSLRRFKERSHEAGFAEAEDPRERREEANVIIASPSYRMSQRRVRGLRVVLWAYGDGYEWTCFPWDQGPASISPDGGGVAGVTISGARTFDAVTC